MAQFGAQGIGFVIAGLAGVLLAFVGALAARRAWTRRRREAPGEAGQQHAFDACAPEGGDLSLEPFRLGRLLADGADESGRRR
jgi:hypothetical protein